MQTKSFTAANERDLAKFIQDFIDSGKFKQFVSPSCYLAGDGVHAAILVYK